MPFNFMFRLKIKNGKENYRYANYFTLNQFKLFNVVCHMARTKDSLKLFLSQNVLISYIYMHIYVTLRCFHRFKVVYFLILSL